MAGLERGKRRERLKPIVALVYCGHDWRKKGKVAHTVRVKSI